MTVEEIKNKLKKKSILFSTGGFRPTNEKLESWIGKAEFNIIHNGNFYFGFNAELEKWEVRCDFY